jgi:hypothetical protein
MAIRRSLPPAGREACSVTADAIVAECMDNGPVKIRMGKSGWVVACKYYFIGRKMPYRR